jgi:formiminoglutamase
MRPMLGRHSGNGFLYAYSEGYLKKYAVFGLHESYNIYSALELFEQHKEQLHFETYDDIFVREQSVISWHSTIVSIFVKVLHVGLKLI